MKKVLVVAAHPDDEVLGCAGTIAVHRKRGDTVWVVILGEGVTSRFSQRSDGLSSRALRRLHQEITKAAKAMGSQKTITVNFPDNAFDSMPLLAVVKKIEEIKKAYVPDILYTHHRGDLNIDHRITFDAVITAFRPLPGEKPVDILSFEIVSSTEWCRPARKGDNFLPNYYVDITKTLNAKMRAAQAYHGEMRKFPHPRSLKGIEVLAQKRGTECGCAAAEAFELIRAVR